MKFSKAQARIIRFPEGRICPFHRTHPDQMAIIFTCPECVYVEDPCGCGCDESCEKCEIGEETRYFCDDCGSVYCGKAKCPKCKSPYWNKQRKKGIINEIEDLKEKALRAREEYYQDLKSHHFNEVPRKKKEKKNKNNSWGDSN